MMIMNFLRFYNSAINFFSKKISEFLKQITCQIHPNDCKGNNEKQNNLIKMFYY